MEGRRADAMTHRRSGLLGLHYDFRRWRDEAERVIDELRTSLQHQNALQRQIEVLESAMRAKTD